MLTYLLLLIIFRKKWFIPLFIASLIMNNQNLTLTKKNHWHYYRRATIVGELPTIIVGPPLTTILIVYIYNLSLIFPSPIRYPFFSNQPPLSHI